ncbi:hypothetical protein CRE_21107 [Caenorhabditis remanei]|uniref:Serpentine receptor class gamma n=1 Tax=Caenorhabditis remanei TaxID=31234 RepID=E3NWE1_CAERE|nr:hypothetical protein CRE_21107 [Caenorhabditis remanei]
MKQSPNAYSLINTLPEYQKFSYHFDYVSIIVLITMICFIPTLISTFKTVLYYYKNSAQNSPNTIHPYVFKSFVYMQVSNIVYIVFDFIINRIPLTSVFTSYFSTMTSESPVKHIVAGYYLFEYLSQLSTVLFCLIRLLVFLGSQNYLKRIQSIGKFIFSGFITTSIVLLTLTMLWNLKSLKKL